ncbi:ladderlectin-like, partial [Plectropomus leopardus]|uniref:ladderlectin-like n=1 Tax=Plectropomus leopardus TaxID=160734 RepID=UPI001C4BDD45
MRLAVVAAVLLVVFTLDSATAFLPFLRACKNHPDNQCSGGWSSIDDHHCAKFFKHSRSFHDAQKHCKSEGADLVSIHSYEEMMGVLCLVERVSGHSSHNFWIGVTRAWDRRRQRTYFKNNDGSRVSYTRWHSGEPNNSNGIEHCVETT